MNTGRFVASAVAVWIVRVALNWTFYTKVIGGRAEQISAAHKHCSGRSRLYFYAFKSQRAG
jgi:hypothetical protein